MPNKYIARLYNKKYQRKENDMHYGTRSKGELNTSHPHLQELMLKALAIQNERKEHGLGYTDITILEGRRPLKRQEDLFRAGKTKTMKSKHLRQSDGYAHALDVSPYPVDWQDLDRFRNFMAWLTGLASSMGIVVRWGGDWDGDYQSKDQSFHDLPHIELVTEDRRKR
jgi:peptidoglycan L-alanyl-D-glutamate endopeptidase CwlK